MAGLVDNIKKVINKAKQNIYICFGDIDEDWQGQEVISAVKERIGKKVTVWVLADKKIDVEANPLYLYLLSKKRSNSVVIFQTNMTPKVFFVNSDAKNFVVGYTARFWDPLSGNYLRDKFMDAAEGAKLVKD